MRVMIYIEANTFSNDWPIETFCTSRELQIFNEMRERWSPEEKKKRISIHSQ